MAWDVRIFSSRRRNLPTLLAIIILMVFGLILSLNKPKIDRSTSRGTFAVFDPVGGIVPGQRQLSGQSLDNVLGFSRREAKLAERVHDVEDENRRLKHQLSVSQNKLMSVMSDKHRTAVEIKKRDKFVGNNDGGGSGGEDDGEYGDEVVEQGARKCDDSGPVLPTCHVVHVAVVCAGHNATRTLSTLVKSILFYRQHPMHFHFVADNASKAVMQTLFDTWKLPQVRVDFYSSESVVDDVSWIPNKHYSGVYGLLKLTLPKILPGHVAKTIVLDTDVALASDISKLWQLFGSFKPGEALGLVENQSDWYIPGKLWKSHSPWPALGRGFNTGVILMHLSRLRAARWSRLWRLGAEKDLVTMYGTSLADQDIFNAVLKQNPGLVHTLPCQWNLQLSDNTRPDACQANGLHQVHLIHFNSPKKLEVEHEKATHFRNHYLTFVQLDGNLLRDVFLPDCLESVPVPSLQSPADKNDECHEVRSAGGRVFRTHPFFVATKTSPMEYGDVTLVCQLSMDRLHVVEALCANWQGPVSLAIYLSDSEADQLVRFVQNSDVFRSRQNVAFHVVYKEGEFYPINYLRNVALNMSRTTYVFLSDVDFLPGLDVYESLKKASRHLLEVPAERRALVVPAFETQRYRLDSFPRTKADVVDLLDEGTLFTFRYHVWPQGHAATNFAKWRTATTPYKIQTDADFEPYIVLPKVDAVPYDNRFVGFGWNKVSHMTELAARQTEFVVLPNVFVVHMPHAPSLDIAKYRSSHAYRRCLEKLKDEFQLELKLKYSSWTPSRK